MNAFWIRVGVIGIFFMAAGLSALHGGGVFWSDRGSGQILRMRFDGGDLEALSLRGDVKAAGRNVRGIAVDSKHELVFWADNGSDRILQAGLDGQNSAVVLQIEGGRSFPADILSVPALNAVWWCDRDRGGIERILIAESKQELMVRQAASSGPYFMDLDAVSEQLYWGEYAGGSIYRSRLDGSDRERLIAGNDQVRGVKVDPLEGMLYWIDRNEGKVYRCPLSRLGGDVVSVEDEVVELLYDGLDTPHGLELDIPARKLYWADTGTNRGLGKGGSAVSRGDMDGRAPQEILATGNQPWDIALDRRCSNYREWCQRVFRRDAAPETMALDADPDGDGLVNIAEYAFDLSPEVPTIAPGRPTSELMNLAGDSGRLHGVTFRWRTGVLDVEYRLEISTDLQTWSRTRAGEPALEIVEREIADDIAQLTATTRYPVDGLAEHYIRLTIQVGENQFSVIESKPVR